MEVSIRDLHDIVEELNETTNGNYSLRSMLGNGWQLVKNNGTQQVTGGYVPKREFYYRVLAYLDGYKQAVMDDFEFGMESSK